METATPRPRRGYSAETESRRQVAAALAALENHHDAYDARRRREFRRAAAAAGARGDDLAKWARVAAALESNEFGVSETGRWGGAAALELGEESVGCGLFAAAAVLNHDCRPSADAHLVIEPGAPPALEIRARRRLQAGDQVTVACRDRADAFEQNGLRLPELGAGTRPSTRPAPTAARRYGRCTASTVRARAVRLPRGYDTHRGDATAATWIVRGDESWRRRGYDVDIPWRQVAATPRPRRG